jgi:surface polysaccharide O-acyltransferase-like enzyme
LAQICFNAANLAISAGLAVLVVQPQILGLPAQPLLISLMLAASVSYFVNTALVSVVLTLVERKSFAEVWRYWCLGSLPYYLVGAIIVASTLSAKNPVSSVVAILIVPSILLATMYYRFSLRSVGGHAIQSEGVSHVR